MDEQTKQILELFSQPAFFAKDGVILWCNRAAGTQLLPDTPLSAVLGREEMLYTLWQRAGTLQLPLTLDGREYDVCVRAVGEGDLFVATPRETALNTTASAVVNASATLRKPLHMMLGAASELFDHIDESADAAALPAASRLNRSIYQFVRLCGQMSDGGSLLLRRKELRRTPTDLPAFFDEFLAQARPLVESAGLTLHYQPLPRPLRADIDTALVERALYNLFSNAINYTPRGGNITLSLRRQERQLLISVTDDGEGISPDVAATLFERFADRPLGDSRRGIGLGLPMVREIAWLHDGTISVSANENGRGTTVRFSLSLEPAPLNLRSRMLNYDYCGTLHHGLVELSDVLGAEMFNPIL